MSHLERGSEWRKWDLHIHTPGTKLNNQFSTQNGEIQWDTFCEKLEESDVSVFGITDYFSIENFQIFIEKYKEKYPNTKKVFLPNIEFRLSLRNKNGEYIHFHVIFSPKEEVVNKIANFLTRLPLISTDNDNLTHKYCTEEHLREVSYEKAMISLETFDEILKNDFRQDEFLLIGVVNGQGSFRPDQSGGRSAEGAKEMDKTFDAFFGIENNVNFYLNKEGERSSYKLLPKAVLKGSDCHSFADMDTKLGKESLFTWVKADPTFEGLRQILYEPEERVKIQINKPEEKSGYHVIESVEIDDEKCKQTIVLNPNLNTIIGGRSTGKSTLLELIAYCIDPTISAIASHVTKISKPKIIWKDKEENKNRDIEFFPQSRMYDVAEDDSEKNKLIHGIVKEKDDKSQIDIYNIFCSNNKSALQSNIDNLFKLQSDLTELRVTLKEKGDESGLKKEIEILQGKIKDSRQKDSLSEDELNKFEQYKKKIQDLEQLRERLERDKNEINILKDEDWFSTSFEYRFNQLSEQNSQAVQDLFNRVKRDAIEQWQDGLSVKLVEIDEQLKKHKSDIESIKNSDFFQKGMQHLEQNVHYKELNGRLNIEKTKLAEIALIQKQISKVEEQQNALRFITIENHIAYVKKMDELISNFSLMHDDIEIKIKKIYLDDKCGKLLRDFINLRRHGRQEYVDNWGDEYRRDVRSSIGKFLEEALDDKIALKSYMNIIDLAKGILTENWYAISYELTYQNDVFEEMSEGKKAFVILKLLLEFSAKECPILIDQPEDSLDNRAIYNELVAYLKLKKKSRQIILVTHNANIVVNADAEEIIVANQHGEDSKNDNGIKFQYISGSLENQKSKDSTADTILKSQGIREHVCEILEGGVDAFTKRENKYGIK